MQQAVTREEFITIGKVLDAACTEFEALLAAEASPCARSLAARKRNYCLPRLERMQFVELVKKSRIASCTPCKVRTICGKVLDRQPVRLSVVPVGLCSIGARRCSFGQAGVPHQHFIGTSYALISRKTSHIRVSRPIRALLLLRLSAADRLTRKVRRAIRDFRRAGEVTALHRRAFDTT